MIIVIDSEHDIYFRKVLANVTFRFWEWQFSISCFCSSTHNLLTCCNWRTLFNMIRNNVDLLLEIPPSNKTGQIPLQIGCNLRSVSATFNQIWLTSIWNRLAAPLNGALCFNAKSTLFYIMIWWQVLIQAIDYSVHTHMIGKKIVNRWLTKGFQFPEFRLPSINVMLAALSSKETLNYIILTAFSLIHCGLMTPYGDMNLGQHWLKIGSGNGLLPDRTKSLPEPMLTYHWLVALS